NNQPAVRIFSSDTSPWNVMHLRISSETPGAIGWDQFKGRNSIQKVMSRGTRTNPMLAYVKLSMRGSRLSALRRSSGATNVVTAGAGAFLNFGAPLYRAEEASHVSSWNSDLYSTSTELDPKSRLNVLGEASILSMNNRYKHITFGVGNGDGFNGPNVSRV